MPKNDPYKKRPDKTRKEDKWARSQDRKKLEEFYKAGMRKEYHNGKAD